MTATAPLADPVIAAIERQDMACLLVSLKTWCERDGRWSQALHYDAYAAKLKQLSERWK